MQQITVQDKSDPSPCRDCRGLHRKPSGDGNWIVNGCCDPEHQCTEYKEWLKRELMREKIIAADDPIGLLEINY